ncbi:MAG: hypothetical protein R6U04_01590 [Bacteroidales bacterium]
MKARNLLKLLFTMTAVFAFTATFAQNPPHSIMIESDATSVDSVTVSDNVDKYLPYYVEPDATLNSISDPYNTSENPESQGIYTSFSWSYEDVSGNDAYEFQYEPAGNDTVPYVKVRFTESNYGNDADTLSVIETSDGGCPGDPVKLPIMVFDEPSFDVTNDTDNDTIEMCDNENYSIQVASITDNGVTDGNLKFHVDSLVENIDADGNSIDAGDGDPIANATVYPTISEDGNLGVTDGVEVFTHDLVARNGDITRYSFTFYGISDHISRKTDYLSNESATDADFTYYEPDSEGNTLVFVVFPPPETGNIQYIPNNFDL